MGRESWIVVLLSAMACGGSFSTTGVAEPISRQVAAGGIAHGGSAAAKATCSELVSRFAGNGSPPPNPTAMTTAAMVKAPPEQPHRIAGTLHAIAGDCSLHSDEQLIAELKRLGLEIGCDAILPPTSATQTPPASRGSERHLEAPCLVYVDRH